MFEFISYVALTGATISRPGGGAAATRQLKEPIWSPHSTVVAPPCSICQMAFGGWQTIQAHPMSDSLYRVGVGVWWTLRRGVAVAVAVLDETRSARPHHAWHDRLCPSGENPGNQRHFAAGIAARCDLPHDPLCQNALSLALNLKHG